MVQQKQENIKIRNEKIDFPKKVFMQTKTNSRFGKIDLQKENKLIILRKSREIDFNMLSTKNFSTLVSNLFEHKFGT